MCTVHNSSMGWPTKWAVNDSRKHASCDSGGSDKNQGENDGCPDL